MKCSSAALLCTAPAVLASPLDKRQNPLAALVNSFPPSYIIHPLNVRETTPKLRPTATRKLIKYGPFKLPANTGKTAKPAEAETGHSHGGGKTMGKGTFNPLEILTGQKPMDPNGFSTMRILADGAMCTDCTVLAGKIDVVFENDTRADIANGVYLHHVITIDLTNEPKSYVTGCSGATQSPNAPKMATGALSTFLGGAVDAFTQYYTTPDGKFNSGYHIKNNKFMMQTEMINYRNEEQNVYILIDLEYVQGQVGSQISHATLSATGCGGVGSAWKPEKNTAGKVVADGYKATAKGHFIGARGHLHDGGTSVSLYVNNKLQCTSNAVYGGEGGKLTVDGREWETISKMTECLDPIPVNAGDIIRIEGTYDTKAHPLRESHGEEQENMAIMTSIFVPDA